MARAAPAGDGNGAVADDHVLGLDVAVDHAVLMGVGECLAQLGAELGDVAVRELAVGRQLVERGALDQLADEVSAAVALPQLVQRHDAGMVEPRRRLGLAQHPPSGAPAGLDHLDRDGALETLVEAAVDGARIRPRRSARAA